VPAARTPPSDDVDVANLNVDELQTFLTSKGVPADVVALLHREQYTGDTFLMLTSDDLATDHNILGGPRKKLLSIIAAYSRDTEHGDSRVELTEHKLAQRQRQLDYGYNTVGYVHYIERVPKDNREPHHCKTPDKYQLCTKRAWAKQVSAWRRALHQWDDV